MKDETYSANREQMAREIYKKPPLPKYTDDELLDAYDFFIDKYYDLVFDYSHFTNDCPAKREATKQLKCYEVAKNTLLDHIRKNKIGE